MQISGCVEDVYDDNGAFFGRCAVSNPGIVTEKIASSELLSLDDVALLPDSLFALVATNDGETLRKYAMHDAGHVVSSMLYFERCAEQIPADTRMKVASNLAMACDWYDVTPSDYVEKTAFLGALNAGLTMYAAPGVVKAQAAKNQSASDSFRAAQASGIKISWQHGGDISAGVPQEKPVKVASHYALHGKYPIDTAEAVKVAGQYFNEYCGAFSTEDQREFSRNVVQRADSLGVKLSGRVEEYGASGYGPYIEAELQKRAGACQNSPGGQGYCDLLETELHVITPLEMMRKISALDQVSGASLSYGRMFPDPVLTVFGGAHVVDKLAASQEYVWEQGRYKTSASALARLTTSSKVAELFGADFAGSFAKDPVGIFESMPEPEKIVLSRLCAT